MGERTIPSVCRDCGADYLETAARVQRCDYQCIACRRVAAKVWRLARKASGRPVVSGKMPREYHREYEAAYFDNPANRERRAAKAREYATSPLLRHKHEARWQARRAIQAGRLVKQPCEVCGTTHVEAHHDDYSAPLSVRWLCPAHHREHHAKARGQA